MPPVLVVVGGLPATGKSTVAALFAATTRTPYLRVDRIEQAVVDGSALSHPVGVVGYAVAHALAAEQLTLGLDVVVECVNPYAETRERWRTTAEAAAAGIVQVELVCSDAGEHRRRVQTRASDVDGLVKPTWEQVVRRHYHQWTSPRLVIDTVGTSVADAAERIRAEVEAIRRRAAG